MKSWMYKVLYAFGIGLIITSGVVAVQVYYNEKHGECISDPLVYASKLYEERTGYPIIGTVTFVGENIHSPIITFNSYGVSVSDPNNPTGLFSLNLSN